MRISDWSSDVCSSDLMKRAGPVVLVPIRGPISPASPVRHLYKAAASITPSGKERRQRRSRVGRAGVELSTIWLQGLVQGAGHELMLFAAVGILLIGLEDRKSTRLNSSH